MGGSMALLCRQMGGNERSISFLGPKIWINQIAWYQLVKRSVWSIFFFQVPYSRHVSSSSHPVLYTDTQITDPTQTTVFFSFSVVFLLSPVHLYVSSSYLRCVSLSLPPLQRIFLSLPPLSDASLSLPPLSGASLPPLYQYQGQRKYSQIHFQNLKQGSVTTFSMLHKRQRERPGTFQIQRRREQIA